ncbi:MAG: MBL fold metallo-hydrolase [Nitrospiraceae bacterium]|jgi:glyoxylase-like metal-dependent hydrolase (beta-lactamase superfamily II)|nr:MBL fold metallo-hydrolase [Nitrospiraceae bacterium]
MSTPEFTIHTVTSGPETFLTNVFLVETAESLVAVDTMMTVSDARALRRRADVLGKPIKAVFITHGHPDHYNGTGDLLEGFGKIPVIATAGVDAVASEQSAEGI